MERVVRRAGEVYAGRGESQAAGELGRLGRELLFLYDDLRRASAAARPHLSHLTPDCLRSAENLIHYVALRRHDIRNLQQSLARRGLSSLGRAESHVLASLGGVLGLLSRVSPEVPDLPSDVACTLGFEEGRGLLRRRTEALFGPRPAGRDVRVMVTMPGEAAGDYALVRELLASGMDCMRVNCAHDDAAAWGRMISHLRRAREETGRFCRVVMDLAGPKLRTGLVEEGPRVLKWRPRRDDLGRVTRPAQVWLTPAERPEPAPFRADAALPVPADFISQLRPGDRVEFTDARGSSRGLVVAEAQPRGCRAESWQTAYVVTGTRMRAARGRGGGVRAPEAEVGPLPAVERHLTLGIGDRLVLTREQSPGRPAARDEAGAALSPARIPCTLPEVFADLRAGERVWFDDGRIGGVVRAADADEVQVEITHARPAGSRLGADKGINLPDSGLTLPPLTEKDLADLEFVVRHSDLVGYSFVRVADDVRELQGRLAALGGEGLGVIIKVETRSAFERLPDILLAAMRSPACGVMIARGDLAVESGFERMAEVQEEIMWLCEAAHMPVVWATQVLEQLSKKGYPSRAEITDAAMSERAECVMLNKGPYVAAAVHTLDDILRRMQAHQAKKSSMLRSLRLADEFFVRHAEFAARGEKDDAG